MAKGKISKVVLLLGAMAAAFLSGELILTVYSHLNPSFKERFKPFLYNEERLHPYCGQQIAIDYESAQKKAPNDYIILLTGGSTALGIGASSEKKMIPVLLEKYLNQKNQFSANRHFIVVNAGNPSYHTTQEKNVFMQFLFLNSDIDMLLCIDGFNNLARPLENYALGLPLNYPGWPWILSNLLDKKVYRRYRAGKLFERMRDNPVLKRSKIIFLASNYMMAVFLKDFWLQEWKSLQEICRTIDEGTKINIVFEGARFYREDVLEMNAIAKERGIRTLFVLQPLLGFLKDHPDKTESYIMEHNIGYDLGLAPYGIFRKGFQRLQQIVQELSQKGLHCYDLTPIFKDVKGRTYDDVMHMNDGGQDIFSKKLADIIISEIARNE